MAEILTHNQTFATPGEALAHHGVKGMRWGVITKDKPTGDRPSARQEARQAKRNAKADVVQARITKTNIHIKELKAERAALPIGFKSAYERNNLNTMIRNNEAYRDADKKTVEALRAGKLTPTQKKLIIGGAVAGSLALAIAYSNASESGRINSATLRGQAFMRGEKFDFKKKPEHAYAATPKQVIDNVLPGINPNYSKQGGKMNCRRCTMAYELRRRGYDVEATTAMMGRGQSQTGLLNALTPGKRNVNRADSLSANVSSGRGIRALARGDKRDTPDGVTTSSVHSAQDRLALLSKLNEQPANARGEAVFNFGGFGHSLSYERFPNGKTYIFDSQKGKGYDLTNDAEYKSFLDKWGFENVRDVQITRLDNLELDHTFLSRWATNSSSKPSTSSRRNTSTRPANMSEEMWKLFQKARA